MKPIWKRNIVVATVLLFVCTAVYLNWRYASNVTDLGAADEAGQKILGESTLVSGETGDTADAADVTTGGEDAAGDAAQDGETAETGTDYFATARLTRQQARDNAISLLREAAESETADAAVANEAAETIQVLAGYALAEAQIENLITAKGYSECVAFMGEDSISVVVDAGDGLNAEDVAKITEVVLAETDYTTDQIKILEAN